MYLFHVTARLHPGKAATFIRLHADVQPAICSARGFVRRILLRDTEHDETFFYISIWNSLADLEAYRTSPAGVAHRDALVAAGVFATTSRVECELIHDDGPTRPGDSGWVNLGSPDVP